MLVPVSHENMPVRRFPVVTVGLIVLTVLLHGFATLDERSSSRALAAVTTAQRFGYVPAHANILGLVTHIFVHADWWHVIGNMWFLFLCGLALEDRWGRLAFGGYYLAAGVVAAGAHHLLERTSTASLIGASGAVAGLMGAFLVLYTTTRIRFVGLVGFRLVWFAAPAYVMLPLWAAYELLCGSMTATTGVPSGVAHRAHVGGFVFGAFVAGAYRWVTATPVPDRTNDRALVIAHEEVAETDRITRPATIVTVARAKPVEATEAPFFPAPNRHK